MTATHLPTFAAIVPVLARTPAARDGLARCLAALLACDPPPAEIVVVDDGSPQPVTVPASGAVALRLLRQPTAGMDAARNAGAAAASAAILVFVDAGLVVPSDTFAGLAAGFADAPDAAAIWGAVTDARPGAVARYKRHAGRHAPLAPGNPALLAAVRRDAFVSAGGFDTRLRTASTTGGGLDRALRDRGEHVRTDTALAAVHRDRTSLGGALRADFRAARQEARTALQRRLRGEIVPDASRARRQLRYLVGVPLGAGALAAALVGWEADLWTALRREEGLPFALACVPLLAVERTAVALAVVAGTVDVARGR